MKTVKKRLGAGFKTLQQSVSQGAWPDDRTLGDFAESSRAFAAMAEPDWKNAMQEYLDHLANLEHAVANRLSEKVCFFKRCLFEDAGSQWRACSGKGSSLKRAKR